MRYSSTARWSRLLALLLSFTSFVHAYQYDPREVPWNLNLNQTATDITDYGGLWPNHQFHPSPDEWRKVIYTIILDRWYDGDPSNNDANGTVYEFDNYEISFRHGGDIRGVQLSLDYLQGLGVEAIYIAGTPFINEPWGADQFSPYDFTILDHHSGTIDQWRDCITEMHARGMYLIVDLTVATLADRVGFRGNLNSSATFTLNEYNLQWKTKGLVYPDFDFNNEYSLDCQLPRFWGEDGGPVDIQWTGCYDSDFDHYGDTEAFGVHPDWQRQLSKFASVQDRLRDWRPSLAPRLQNLACMVIDMLDVDGFRIDKATQMTTDFITDWAAAVHKCAAARGKTNFFIPGEVTGSSSFGGIFYNRGRQPDMRPHNLGHALNVTQNDSYYFLRPENRSGMDATAFHYSVYRELQRFLGLDGEMEIAYDVPQDFAKTWDVIGVNEDSYNQNLGKIDPRHLYGITNHDVFRWPAIQNGSQRLVIGTMIAMMMYPGNTLLYYGDEQGMYVLDNNANNYLYGRQAFSSAIAWQLHGCYRLNSTEFPNMPFEAARTGCYDSWNSLDHADPSHPLHSVHKSLGYIRAMYPAVHHGFRVAPIQNLTTNSYLPASGGRPTIVGLFSIVRGGVPEVQDLQNDYKHTTANVSSSDVWLLFSNMNDTSEYNEPCSSERGIRAPFKSGTTVKNLIYPYETYELSDGNQTLTGSDDTAGCIPNLKMDPWSFKLLVPSDEWYPHPPTVTKFTPGHDHRLPPPANGVFEISIEFDQAMDCDDITNSISFNSTTYDGTTPTVDASSVQCSTWNQPGPVEYVAQPASVFSWTANLNNVREGIHRMKVQNVSNAYHTANINAVDHFLLRFGLENNPMVWYSANVSDTLLIRQDDGYYLNHSATGAQKFRYSMDFSSSWSRWLDYDGKMTKVNDTMMSAWTGTSKQAWKGEHVVINYWNENVGSADHVQTSDIDAPARTFPHLFLMGPFNQWGYDSGIQNELTLQESDNEWVVDFTSDTWPAKFQFNVWGINPDGKPDQGFIYGDIDKRGVVSRLAPSALEDNIINLTDAPPTPHLAWQIRLNNYSRRYSFVARGHHAVAMAMYVLMILIPPITAMIAVFVFKGTFYQIKFNKEGRSFAPSGKHFFPLLPMRRRSSAAEAEALEKSTFNNSSDVASNAPYAAGMANKRRKCVLIATLEYDISDWQIRIKIGGLGVMAQLMGQNLKHQDVVWVVPCVGDIEYPDSQPAQPIEVKIIDQTYTINVFHHFLDNIKYVLLDAPVFRRQTSSEPYPARMDDLGSAIFYSAWNQCIAEVIRRNPIDLYHINDYHGALAPCYLLPDVIPIAVSLHNAEFQGLWPLRTPEEKEEVCAVYNIPPKVCTKYVQFGNVFNLLHAGVSYLRIHQKGFGAVGVSNKYGKRSWARYPIFWGLKKIGKLPNPDPSDTAALDPITTNNNGVVEIDKDFESRRMDFKREAQEWAGLNVDPKAQLMVFVGRWSMQKGIDLIADLAPTLLNDYNVQIIAVGPVIDLYGKFAAEKFSRLMGQYPGKLFSRPEFTSLPPYIFSGADFALIPSRDEPFGLVAVEFGRKGALGIGARVGGLGQMPGWWYTVESPATSHLLRQFESACRQALNSSEKTRAMLRAKSAKQRFPVAEWQRKLDLLQDGCIRYCNQYKRKREASSRSSIYSILPDQLSRSSVALPSQRFTNMPNASNPVIDVVDDRSYGPDGTHSRTDSGTTFSDATTYNPDTHGDGRIEPEQGATGLKRQLSLGSRQGPGHDRRHASFDDNLDSIEEDQGEEKDAYYWTPESVRARLGHNSGERTPSEYSVDSGDEDFDPQRATMYDFFADDDAAIKSSPAYRPQINRSEDHGGLGISMSQDDLTDPNRSGFFDPQSSPPETPAVPRQAYASPQSPPLTPGQSQTRLLTTFRNESRLSLASVMTSSNNKEFALSKTERKFTDEDNKALRKFSAMIRDINPKSSKDELCIEHFIEKSEKDFFNEIRREKLGLTKPSKLHLNGQESMIRQTNSDSDSRSSFDNFDHGRHSPMGDDVPVAIYGTPKIRGLKRFMQRRFGDWPVYSFFLALGQILASTSFQLTLLSGSSGSSAEQLYIIGAFFLVGSLVWWIVYRKKPNYVVLSYPFLFYALAFFLIGLPGFPSLLGPRNWIDNIATWLYAVASSSGSLYFALNFGDEGGAGIQSWVFRACVVQGTQQVWASALWYWGSHLDATVTDGYSLRENTTPAFITGIVWPLSLIMIGIFFLVNIGLPDYYRQIPGNIPAFYTSLIRRKLVLWFLIATILQNYWLSTLYGRSWKYVWGVDSSIIQPWITFLLVLLFFIVVWGLIIFILGYLSKTHAWLIPVFGVGLGAPRWAQQMWGTSQIGLYIPWAGAAGPYLGRCLWLWLGVLDALQGVGIGMILLQTLTRIHVATTLMSGQVVGTVFTMIARATAPNKVGPGTVYINLTAWTPSDGAGPFANAAFWICLICQLAICIGYFQFFRKEQLAKP